MGLTLKLALRTLARRKGRMALIGILVAFGTFLIVFGTIFASSANIASRKAIIDNFTGDFILYSDRSKDRPSPFAFSTPLPLIKNVGAVEAALRSTPEVEAYAPYAQNYGIIQAQRRGRKVDLPFIFYAVDPEKYRAVFGSPSLMSGSFFEGMQNRGVLVSVYQNEQYKRNYGLELTDGEDVTLLGITEGGVNTTRSRVAGIFEPVRYTSVFNYINFMDAESYAALYNYTGVEALPESLNRGLAASEGDEAAIFGLADNLEFGSIDVSKLKAAATSGATMIAVRLKDHGTAERVMARFTSDKDLGVQAASWEKASGFYAQIASGLQAFIYLATALIFLVVALIFMNTLIINVTERTAEIGTMSALGADSSFIRGMFLAETLILNVASAAVGMIAALIAMIALGKRGVALPEIVSQFLIGGGSLKLAPSVAPFVTGLIVVVVVSILATIYPVRVATRITPLKAMSER
jgi:ABC-type lipoprotein release transport system permease subunit